MSGIRLRRLVHRGRVEAAALLFDEASLGAAETRRRILALWRPGAEVARLDERRLLLRLDRPLWVDAGRAPGGPLVAVPAVSGSGGPSRMLSAAPLDEAEIEALGGRRDAVVVVEAGAARVVTPADLPREDPAGWIDLSGWRMAPTRALGTPPEVPKLAAPSPPADARKVLGKSVPAADPERAVVLEALGTKSEQDGAGGRHGRSGRPGGRGLARSSWRLRLARWLGREVPTAPSSSASRGSGHAPSGPRRRVRAWLSHLLMSSALGRQMGRAQGRYLRRMMQDLERGDLDEALRRAIPLSGLGDPADAAFLGIPSPRSELKIDPHRGALGSSISLPPDVHEALRRQYRRAFESLEARGEWERAAFVLAELLGADTEAVAFLERHGRLRQAAELAEARSLPPGLVVRQWFVAGEVERAIQVARRTGAFADAVGRLELQNHPEAPRFRLLWAESLAAAGDFLPAVRTAWPVTEARRLVERWIEMGLAAGGAATPALLAHRVAIVAPGNDPAEALRLVRELLDREDEEAPADRAAFSAALLQVEPTHLVRTVARAAARAALAEAGSGKDENLRRLVGLCADTALRTDLNLLPTRSAGCGGPGVRPWAESWRVEAEDRGSRSVEDAVRLAGGRYLVALGEAGVDLLDARGERVAHFDQPAHRLVAAHHGAHAIALARRGEAWKVARLDLARRRANAWCDLRLHAFAERYDGGLWFVAREDEVLALDCRSPGAPEALWRIPDLPGGVSAIDWSPDACHFVVQGELTQCWRLAIPELTLRGRDDLVPEWSTGPPRVLALGPDGRVACALPREPLDDSFRVVVMRRGEAVVEHVVPPAERTPLAWPMLAGSDLFMAQPGSAGMRIVLSNRQGFRVWGHLGGAGRVSLRAAGHWLTVGDDRGRLLGFDLRDGRRTVDTRL